MQSDAHFAAGMPSKAKLHKETALLAQKQATVDRERRELDEDIAKWEKARFLRAAVKNIVQWNYSHQAQQVAVECKLMSMVHKKSMLLYLIRLHGHQHAQPWFTSSF